MAQVDKIFFEKLKLNIKFNKLDCTKSTIVEDRTLDDFLKDEVYKFAYDFVRKCVALTLQSEDVFVKIFTRAELLYEYTLSLEHLELRWSDVMNKANSLFDFWDKDYDSFADFYYSLVTKAIPNTAHILYVFYILLYKRNPDKKGVPELLYNIKTYTAGPYIMDSRFSHYMEDLTNLLENKDVKKEVPSQLNSNFTFGKYRIAKGKETDFVKIMTLLYEHHFFVKLEDGSYASNRNDVINSLVEKNINVAQLVKKGFETDNAMEVFRELLDWASKK